MNDRIIELRHFLKLNQKEFAESLGIGQSTLAMIETGKREINKRHIKLILSTYRVREDWLLNGNGPMFEGVKTELHYYLGEELSEIDNIIVNSYLALSKKGKEIVSQFILGIAEQCGYTPPNTTEQTMEQNQDEE